MGLFFTNLHKLDLIGYADVGYINIKEDRIKYILQNFYFTDDL